MQDKKLILIVEDNPKQAEAFADIINDTYSYQAITANNGIQALDIIKKHRRVFGFCQNKISCILLDLQMPVMDGETFLKKLRLQERRNIFCQFLPVIVLTAYDEIDRWRKTTDPIYGMVADYLIKPIDEKKLLYLLNEIVFKIRTEDFIEDTLNEYYKKIEAE